MNRTETTTPARRSAARSRTKPAPSKAQLEEAVARLEKKLKRSEAKLASYEREKDHHNAAAERLRRQGSVLAELAKSDELAREDFSAFVRIATERAAETLGVERVGVWFFNDDRTVLRCEHLYEASFRRHGRGAELEARNYPRYFAALVRGRSVAAEDACRDAATSEFLASYLVPLGIGALLDAPLRRGGRLIGVVCHEHVGGARSWLPEEQEFAASVAEFVSLALETSERRRAEQASRAAQSELLQHQQQEKRRVEAELEALKGDLVRQTRLATVGQVAASIAHELRNPLGALRNVAYLLRRGTNLESRRERYLDIVEQEIRQADRIVGDLLEMSRAKQPAKAGVDLKALALEALEYAGDHGQVALEVKLAPDPFAAFADAGQLRQVLANLFTNSVQAFNGRSGRIVVRAQRDGTLDRIFIADDGPGVPKAIRRQIFEPLFTTKAKGTGLGLAICKQIVEGHGGSIELGESRKGSVFCICLPARPAA